MTKRFLGVVTVTNAAGTTAVKADGTEVHMKCGEGTVQGCVCEDAGEYIIVCADGRKFRKADVGVGIWA